MVKIEGLSFSYGDKPVLSGFSAGIGDGVTVLTGPSGCGKTTLLKLVAGLLVPTAGEISGAPRRPAFMFQEDRLIPWLTVRENVAAVAEGAGVEGLLRAVELTELADKLPGELSGGQARRAALARALLYGGDMLILDEPMKGLHEELAVRMIELVKGRGVPVIVTCHSAFEAEHWGGTTLRLG